MDDRSLIANEGDDGLSFELLAASLRADETDARAFLGALAVKLEGALPSQTRVRRARDGLLKSSTHVAAITVDLSPFRYTLSAGKHGALEATRAKVVGNVAIKTETLSIEVWIEELAHSLADFAARSAGARAALERLLM